MASTTKEEALEILKYMYDELPLPDRIGKRGEALSIAMIQLRNVIEIKGENGNAEN